MIFTIQKIVSPAPLLLASILGLLVATSTQAEIYKWTDAQGKVHYSDKKIADTAQAQSIDLGTMPEAKPVKALTATSFQHSRPTLYLLRQDINFHTLTTLRNPDKFAYIYFGGDCVSPTTVSYDEYLKRFKSSLPKSSDIFLSESQVLGKYNVRSQHLQYSLNNPKRALDEQGNPPLKLSIDILDMRINACVQRLNKSAVSGNLDKITTSSFDKANVWLKLRITLSNFTDDVVLFNTITEGAINELDAYPGHIYRLTSAAYEQAVTNLIANPKFAELLLPKPKEQKINIVEHHSSSELEEGGLLNRLAEKFQFNAVKKSKLAQAMSLVSPVRMNIVQYYADTGKWPNSFADINLNSSDLQQKDLIDSAELRLGGVLHLRLAKSTFGDNEVLQLIPKSIMGGQTINWECRTSLDKALWVGDCMGL